MPDKIKYIYESPDGGKTVTKREFGSNIKEDVWVNTPESDAIRYSNKTQLGIDIIQNVSRLLEREK